jgi:hypothetical protein
MRIPGAGKKTGNFFSNGQNLQFLPKIANSALEQGICRELAGNFRFGGELPSTQTLAAFHAL